MSGKLFRIALLVAAAALILAACTSPTSTPAPVPEQPTTIQSLTQAPASAAATQAPAPTALPAAVASMPFTHTACPAGVDLTGQTVNLYHLLALVGEQTDTFLQPLKAGFDDATEYFNAHGGICGATLGQVFANTVMSPQDIYDRDMALEPKPVMVALYASGDAVDLRDQLAKDEVPGLGIRVGSIPALYGEDGQTPGWIFGTNPLYVEQVGAMCDYIAAHPELFPKPVLGFISWDEGWAHSADTAETQSYCNSVGVGYAGASYFASDATDIDKSEVQKLVDAGANILYTNSLADGPALVAKTLDEMGLQGKVTLAGVNWAMDPTVGLLGAENLRADGLPAMSGMIGSLPLRSWAEANQPGIQLIAEQADLHKRPQQVRNNFYTLAWASTDLFIETYIQTGKRVGFDAITGAEMKKTLENIVYAPLGGVEKIDFQGGARRTLSADRIGQMDYLGADGKTPAGPNNPPKLIKDGGQQNMVPMLVPLSDFQTAPDLRPGGADVVPASESALTNTPTAVFDPNRPNDATQARLRVSECVYDQPLPNMDIYINGEIPVVADVPLTNVPTSSVTRYEYLAPGTVSVAVVPTGKGLDTPFLGPLDVSLEAGHRYTLVVMGEADGTMRQGLVIDETVALQKAGVSPDSAGHITVNNVLNSTGISFLLDGVGEMNVPYGGYAASIQPAVFKEFNIGENVNGKVIKTRSGGWWTWPDTGSKWTWPGVDSFDCFHGWYNSPTNRSQWSGDSPRTSDLNMSEFLQGFSDQHGKNGDVPSFDTFLTAVKTAGLTDLLTNGGPHLIFAPTDKAFASLPKDQLDALMADPKALGDFLSSYIVEGYYPPYTLGGDVDGDNYEPDRTVINLLGKELVLSARDGSLSINRNNMQDVGNSMIANGSRVFLVQNLMKLEGK